MSENRLKTVATNLWSSTKTHARNLTLKALRARVAAAVKSAEPHLEDQRMQEAMSQITNDWEQLDLADMKKLAGKPVSEVNRLAKLIAEEKEQARREANAFANRAGRAGEIISLMNDESALAVFNAGAVMSKDEHKNFKKVLKSHAPSGTDMVSSYQAGYINSAASGRYPDEFEYCCAVGQILDTDRQLLRIGAILMKHQVIKEDWLECALAGVIYHAGNGRLKKGPAADSRGAQIALNAFKENFPIYLIDPNTMQQEIVRAAQMMQKQAPNDPATQEIAALAGGGATWFTSPDVPNSIYNLEPHKGLFLGQLEDGGYLHYDGEGSLFTIAPPGSGKTQCQVMTNLIMYEGPSIVLDIKGECFEQTAGFRSQHLGPVLRFAPDDWDGSAHYNPLDFVRDHPRHLPSDARKLADMLIVPTGGEKDPYWQNRGRDVLAAIIGYVATNFPPEDRNMKTVTEFLSPSQEGLDGLVAGLRESEFDFLRKTGNQIDGMRNSEKQLFSIFDSARDQLSVWDLGELDPITDRSDWHPQDFKTAGRPLTLYICVGPADVQRFASVIRVIIGQHLDYFMDVLPDNRDQPIVFFLDEVPQLGKFEPLPKASSLGRQYGLRLWLFAQNRDQIEANYGKADTILGNAVVQCWMDPDEKAGAELERNLGTMRGLFDGQEKPLVQSHELRGPDYRNYIIAVGRGEKPARLRKYFAHEDSSLKECFGLPIVNGGGAAEIDVPPSPPSEEVPKQVIAENGKTSPNANVQNQ